jgi:hypothetical protein
MGGTFYIITGSVGAPGYLSARLSLGPHGIAE